MAEILMKIIKDTIKTGIGQSIIAFSTWGYVGILFFVLLYYCIRSLIKLLTHK